MEGRGAFDSGRSDAPDRAGRRTPAGALVLVALLLFGAGVQVAPTGRPVAPLPQGPSDGSSPGGSNATAASPPASNAMEANPPTSNGSGGLPAPAPVVLAEAPAAGGGFVTYLYINASIVTEELEAAGGNPPAEPISLPHCAWTYYDGSTLRGFDPAYENDTRVVVIVDYTDRSSFSGGGDDRRVAYLQSGEQFDVVAAYARPTVLYTVSVGDHVTVQPAAASAAPPLLTASYSVSYNASAYPWTPNGNLTVSETHAWTVHEHVPLQYAGRGVCE